MPAVQALAAVVTRETTAPTELFTLPAGSTLVAILISGAEQTDAESGGFLSVGSAGIVGSSHGYVHRHPLHGRENGRGQQFPQTRGLGPVGDAPVTVTGHYTEGTPSSRGGPWLVTALYF